MGVSTSPPLPSDLALALHDLSIRLGRFAPAKAGVEALPASELLVLRTIMASPGSSVTEVAAAAAMQPSNVSTAVRALTRRGLVDKHPHPDDRRISLLSPSALARSNKTAIDKAVTSAVSTGLRALSDDHRAALIAALPAIRALNVTLAESLRRDD